MKRGKLLFIVIAIIVFLIICIMLFTNFANTSCKKYHYYLSGMWIGDPEFLKKSNLKDLQIFISPKENKNRSKSTRSGYIIMVNTNGDILINQPIDLKEITSSHNQRWAAYNMDKKIKNDSFDIQYQILNDIEDFPKNITMSVSITNGSLVIKNNNTTYALCEKDLISSAAAIVAYEEE
jgi:hypothetical protein